MQTEYINTNFGNLAWHYLPDDLVKKYYDFKLNSAPTEPADWTLTDLKTGKQVFAASDAKTWEDVRLKLIEDARLPGGFVLIIFDDQRREIQSDTPAKDDDGNQIWRNYTEGCYVIEMFFGDKLAVDGEANEFLTEDEEDKGLCDFECKLTDEEKADLSIDSDVADGAYAYKLPLKNGAVILWVEFPDHSELDTIVKII